MSDSGMHIVKVAVELYEADKQGEKLRSAIQTALNNATKKNAIVVHDFRFSVNKEAVSKFRIGLQQQITNELQHNPIKLKFQASNISVKERKAMLADLQADLDKQNLVVNIAEINAAQAINNLKSQLTNMLSGLTVGGLKAFLGADAIKDVENSTNVKILNSIEKSLGKAYEGIKDGNISDKMLDEYKEILLLIDKAKRMELDAQNEQIESLRVRVRVYREALALEQELAAQQKKAAESKPAKEAAKKKEADDALVVGYQVEELQKKVTAARESLGKLDDVKLKGDLEKDLNAIEEKLEKIPQLTGKARTDLMSLVKTNIGDAESKIEDALSTPEREQNETEIKALTSAYDALIKKVREGYQNIEQRDQTIAKLREEQNAVKALHNATTEHQSEAMSGLREKLVLSQKEVQAVKDAQKAEANKDKTAAAAARAEISNLSRAISIRQKINEWIKNNQRAYAAYRSQIDMILTTLQDEGNLTDEVIRKASLSFKEVTLNAQKAGIAGNTFFSMLRSVWDKISGTAVTGFLTNQVTEKLRQAVQAVRDIDAAMTELKKVTDLTAQSYDHFVNTATNMSRKIGATLADTISSTADFARLGYTLRESTMLAEAALTYKNVGDGITDISVATESLISTIKAFGVEAMDSMEIVDKFNEVGNNFAISSAGIGDAMQRSASALASAGNDLNESIGLVTGMNAVVQDPDIVGTALKTISMYLRAAKTEAEEAGIATDGMANSVAELRDSMLSLTGVDIMLDANTFKSTFQIMKELAGVWSQLTDVSQANVLEMIGGKRNGNVVTSLLTNFDSAIGAMEAARNAAGSATLENEKYLDSINGKLAIMQANFEALSSSIIDSDIIKWVLDLGNGIMAFVNWMNDAKVLLPAIAAGFAAIKAAKLFDNVRPAGDSLLVLFRELGDSADTFADKIDDLDDNGKKGVKSLEGNINSLTDREKTLLKVQLENAVMSGKVSRAFADQAIKMFALDKATDAFNRGPGSKATKVFSGMLEQIKDMWKATTPLEKAAAIIGTVYSVFDFFYDKHNDAVQNLINKSNELSDAYADSTSTYKKNIESLNGLRTEYNKLLDGVDPNTGENVSLTSDEYDRYLDIIGQIADISPDVVSGYENERIALNDYRTAVDDAIRSQKEWLELQKDILLAEGKTKLRGSYKEINKAISSSGANALTDIGKVIYDFLSPNSKINAMGDMEREQKEIVVDIFDSILGGIDPNGIDAGRGELLSRYGIFSDTEISHAIAVLYQNRQDIVRVFASAAQKIYGPEMGAELTREFNKAMTGLSPTYNTIQTETTEVVDYLEVYLEKYYGDLYKQIPDSMQSAFKKGLERVALSSKAGNAEKNAMDYLQNFVVERANAITDADKAFAQYRNKEIDIESYYGKITAIFEGHDNASKVLADFYKGKTNSALSMRTEPEQYMREWIDLPYKLAEVVEDGAKGYELISKLTDEAKTPGGILPATLAAVDEYLGDLPDKMSVKDLYDGKGVLDIDKLRDIVDGDVIGANVSALKAEERSLRAESEMWATIAASYADAEDNIIDGDIALRNYIRSAIGFKDNQDKAWRQSSLFTSSGRLREFDIDKDALRADYVGTEAFEAGELFLNSVSAGIDELEGYELEYNQNVIWNLAVVDKNGRQIDAEEANRYLTGLLYDSDGKARTIDEVWDLDKADEGSLGLIASYRMVDASESLAEAERANQDTVNNINTAYKQYMSGRTTFSKYDAEQYSEALSTQADMVASDAEYWEHVTAGIGKDANLSNLSNMWDEMGSIGKSAKPILEAINKVNETGALELQDLVTLGTEISEYDPSIAWENLVGDQQGQLDALNSVLAQRETVLDEAIQKYIDHRQKEKDKLVEELGKEQAEASDEWKVLDAETKRAQDIKDLSITDLFPVDVDDAASKTVKEAEKALEYVKACREFAEIASKEIKKAGKLTADTEIAANKLFGANYADIIYTDPSDASKGINVDNIHQRSDAYVESTLNVTQASQTMIDGIKGAFSTDPGEIKAAEHLENLMSLISNVYGVTGTIDNELAAYGSNSISTLGQLVSLMGEDYALALDTSTGKIKINTAAVQEWYTKQLASYADLDVATKKAIDDAYEQAEAMQNLQNAISGVGKASSLIDTIQEEISEGGTNTLDTLLSFAETLGEGWQEYVNFSGTGFTLSTDAVYQQMAKSIDAVIPPSDKLNAVLKAQLDTALKAEQANKTLTESYAGLETAVSGYANIGSGIELTHDMISQLIEVDSRYAQAIEYQNGRLQLNKEKYDEVTASVQENTKAQAEAAAQAILSGKEYQDLIRKMTDGKLTSSEQNRLDSLNAQVMAFEVMASAVDSSTSALQRFLNATDQVNAVTYEGAQSAYQTIKDVLYNKDSDMFGMIGHEKFEEALKLMISPDVEIDSKEFKKQYKILERYFEDSSKGMSTLHDDMIKKGIIDKSTGTIKTTIGEAAELLGLTENALRFAVDQYNQYQLDKNKIDIGGMGNQEVQEKTGIGKVLEDAQTIDQKMTEWTQNPLAIPVDPTLENLNAVNAGLTETQHKVAELNGTTLSIGGENASSEILNDLIASYRDEIKMVQALNVDPEQLIFGNIDTSNRAVLEWTEENLAKYKEAYESLGYTAEDLRGKISTVMGASGNYENIEIAYSPILQTADGPKLLTADTIDQYIYGLFDKANEDGVWSSEELFALDVTGLEIAGEKISGILAGVGDNAIYAAEAMHFVGPDGAIIGQYAHIAEIAAQAGISIDEVNKQIFDGIEGADRYRIAAENASKAEVDTSGTEKPMADAKAAADEASESINNVSVSAGTAASMVNQIGKGDMDVDTSSIIKDLINVLNALGDIAKKLDAIDGMDVDANINVSQTTSTKGGTTFTSEQMDLVNKYISGNASASGTRKAAGGKTLVGELGMETVVDPSTNRWYTVGTSGPEFVNLPKNAIVLNADQTRELFRAGRTNGRGQSMVSGTQYRSGKSMATGNFTEDDKEELIFVDWRKTQKEAQEKVDTVSTAAPTAQQVLDAATKAANSGADTMSGTPDKPKTSSNKKGSGGGSSSSKEKEEEQTVLEKLQEEYQKLIDQHEHLIEHQEFLFRNAERGMDFGGMETSLSNQIQIYKDMMADAQKGISEMVANGASDTDKELQSLEEAYWNAHDSMYEALSELNTLYVEGLTEKIDNIQSAYSNLANAADELASSGTISVDTFQSLMDNGVQYMSLLEKVNGQYVINEEAINRLVAAEKKRLAVESALSYLGQVQQAVNDKDVHLLQNLTELNNRIGDGSWDAVYAQVELLKTMGLTGDQYNAVFENINALKAVSEAVSGDITTDAKEANDAIGNGLKDQQDALDEILELTQDLIEHETEERIEAIEKEIDQFKEIIRLKKESLQTTKEENDYMDSVAEKTSEIAKLQAKIDQLSLDDSRSAAAERAALQEELSNLQKELGDMQSDHAYDAQVEALEKQEEAYEKDRQQEIDNLEDSISSAEKLYQASIERLNGGWGSLYEQLIAWNTEVGSSLNSEITEGWEKAAEAVKLYGSYSAAVKQIDNKINAGEDKNIAVSKSDLPIFHDGGVVGGNGVGDEIMAIVQKGEVVINEAGQQVLYKIIDFQRYLGEKLGKAFGSFDFSGGTMRNAVAALPSSIGALNATADTSSPFVFSPSISVEITGGTDMNAHNARQFGEKIASTAIDQLREAFGRKGVTSNMSTRLRQS